MKLCEQLNNVISESVQKVKLDGKEYQIEIQKGISALIKYEFDNPDMGNFDDFKDDKERLKKLTKSMKKLDVQTVKEQIEMLVSEGEISVQKLLKDKVIK